MELISTPGMNMDKLYWTLQEMKEWLRLSIYTKDTLLMTYIVTCPPCCRKFFGTPPPLLGAKLWVMVMVMVMGDYPPSLKNFQYFIYGSHPPPEKLPIFYLWLPPSKKIFPPGGGWLMGNPPLFWGLSYGDTHNSESEGVTMYVTKSFVTLQVNFKVLLLENRGSFYH